MGRRTTVNITEEANTILSELSDELDISKSELVRLSAKLLKYIVEEAKTGDLSRTAVASVFTRDVELVGLLHQILKARGERG